MQENFFFSFKTIEQIFRRKWRRPRMTSSYIENFWIPEHFEIYIPSFQSGNLNKPKLIEGIKLEIIYSNSGSNWNSSEIFTCKVVLLICMTGEGRWNKRIWNFYLSYPGNLSLTFTPSYNLSLSHIR